MSEKLYEPFHIKNATNCFVEGSADYSLPNYCNPDPFKLEPYDSFTAKNRGACLLRSVSATVTTPDGKKIQAKEFTSSGTGLSQFVIVQISEDEFMVTLANV